jgi:hypothetical protein
LLPPPSQEQILPESVSLQDVAWSRAVEGVGGELSLAVRSNIVQCRILAQDFSGGLRFGEQSLRHLDAASASSPSSSAFAAGGEARSGSALGKGSDYKLLYRVGICALAVKRVETAIDLLTRALERCPAGGAEKSAIFSKLEEAKKMQRSQDDRLKKQVKKFFAGGL